MKAFGVMGLFIGPIVLSVTMAVLDMLREVNSDWQASQDEQPAQIVSRG
jgi:predicted PurR-regulated permease PerM